MRHCLLSEKLIKNLITPTYNPYGVVRSCVYPVVYPHVTTFLLRPTCFSTNFPILPTPIYKPSVFRIGRITHIRFDNLDVRKLVNLHILTTTVEGTHGTHVVRAIRVTYRSRIGI